MNKLAIGPRIAQLRQWCKLTQAQMAKLLREAPTLQTFSRSGLSQIESGITSASLDVILAVVSKFDIHLDWLMTGAGMVFKYTNPDILKEAGMLGAEDADLGLEAPTGTTFLVDQAGLLATIDTLPEAERDALKSILAKQQVEEAERGNLKGNLKGNPIDDSKTKSTPDPIRHLVVDPPAADILGKTLRPVVSTVSPSGADNIILVDQRAAAGYLTGYGDPEYVESLPAFQLPGLRGRCYRAFQVVGNSMMPTIDPGDVIVASYLENWLNVRDERVYVIVSPNEGITIKRVYNYLKADGSGYLLCEPDNNDYRAFRLTALELAEIWQFEARITWDLATPSRDIEKRLLVLEEQVADIIEATEVRRIEVGAEKPQKGPQKAH